jgi:hypothetical protein
MSDTDKSELELRDKIHTLFYEQSLQYPVDSSEVRWNVQEVMKIINQARIDELDKLEVDRLNRIDAADVLDRIKELQAQAKGTEKE